LTLTTINFLHIFIFIFYSFISSHICMWCCHTIYLEIIKKGKKISICLHLIHMTKAIFSWKENETIHINERDSFMLRMKKKKFSLNYLNKKRMNRNGIKYFCFPSRLFCIIFIKIHDTNLSMCNFCRSFFIFYFLSAQFELNFQYENRDERKKWKIS